MDHRHHRANLSSALSIRIDMHPGPHGEHRHVRLYDKGRLIANMPRRVFEKAIKAYQEAQ